MFVSKKIEDLTKLILILA